MSDLRDHSQPCEHATDPTPVRLPDEPGPVGTDPVWKCSEYGCPGGREITIDYEAAITTVNLSSHGFVGDKYIIAAVAAAIGDVATGHPC